MADGFRPGFAPMPGAPAPLDVSDLRAGYGAGDVLRGIHFSLLGAALMLLSDVLARSLAPSEIPVSVITSLLGAPTLFLLLYARRGGADDG